MRFGYNKFKKNYYIYPAINIIINNEDKWKYNDVQIHFAILNFHFWISITTKGNYNET